MEIKRLSFQHKNNKLVYYLKNYLRQLIPNRYFQNQLNRKLKKFDKLSPYDQSYVQSRVDYYIKVNEAFRLAEAARPLSDLSFRKDLKTYYFDLFEHSRYFDQDLMGHFLFGDITDVYYQPALVKSRPIHGDNINSVLLKWNKVRHFTYVNNDHISFDDKNDVLVSRGVIKPKHKHRLKFLELYFDHPMTDIGKVNLDEGNTQWNVPRMTINEQLAYKFILCLEGNDVASSLKWVMSSGSLAVMPKPTYETWFMEGQLIPDFHYIEIDTDYGNLEEKLNYFIDHPEKAKTIIQNANQYVQQFKNKEREDLISLMVLDKYFRLSNQLL